MEMNNLKVGMVVDPWDLPFNATVVSARRFVAALSDHIDFRVLMTASTAEPTPDGAVLFEKISIPGINHIIDRMQAPVAKPNTSRLDELMADIERQIAGKKSLDFQDDADAESKALMKKRLARMRRKRGRR